MEDKKIAIIGCGNLGLSIINGLIRTKAITPSNIIATKRNIESIEYLKKIGIYTSSNNSKAIQDSEIIIVALKPYNILEVLNEIKDYLNPEKHIIVSLATGISIEKIQNQINDNIPIFRAMPNTAADVALSVTCLSSNTKDQKIIDSIKNLFNSIGTTVYIEEELMDSATVLGACGIAFVLKFIRGMIQGGIQIGFDVKTATEIVNHTVKGAAELLIKNEGHPESEIDKVTTPKGCTIAGLNEMEHNGFSSALIKGIITSFDKIEKKH